MNEMFIENASDTTHTIQTLNIILDTIQQQSPDHRCLLGLFPSSKLPQMSLKSLTNAFKPIVQVTVPYISQIWKTYCNLTHQSTTPQFTPHTHPTLSHTPRLTIISGNNGSISTTTVTDHPPPAYSRKRRERTNHYPQHYTQQSIPHNPPATQPSAPPTSSITPTHSSFTLRSQSPATPTSAPSNDWCLPTNPLRITSQLKPPNMSNTSNDANHNTFSILPTDEPCTPESNSPLALPPHQTFTTLTLDHLSSPAEIIANLHMTITDVPPNGDCFYNVIQLFLTTLNDPVVIHIPHLRKYLTTLYNTRVGQTILNYYNQSTHIIEASTLPNLKPSHFPNRDIAAQDYDIASMASLLNTDIHVYL